MEIKKNILAISNKFDIFLFDAFGVFWSGSEFFEGSREAMKKLKDMGKMIVVLSNTTTLMEETIESYRKKGLNLGEHYDYMITSGEATRQALFGDGSNLDKSIFTISNYVKKVYTFGSKNAKLFASNDNRYQAVDTPEEADFIYISVPRFKNSEYEEYIAKNPKDKTAFKVASLDDNGNPKEWDSVEVSVFEDKIKNIFLYKKPFLNANPDFTANEADKITKEKNFVVRQGSIAEILRGLGATVVEFGKPHKNIYDFTFKFLVEKGVDISNKNRIAMIGDTLRTDIKGANNTGIKSVLCCSTGVTANESIKNKCSISDLIKKECVVVDYCVHGVGCDVINKGENMGSFELVPGLAKKSFIMDLKLSKVLFEDNKLYPWVFLVPMKNGVKNMTYLTLDERLQLMREIALVEAVMVKLFNPDQTNVAMIGNKTPQLHVHVLCRKEGDADWPGTVWGNSKEAYSPEEKELTIAKIKKAIEEEKNTNKYWF